MLSKIIVNILILYSKIIMTKVNKVANWLARKEKSKKKTVESFSHVRSSQNS